MSEEEIIKYAKIFSNAKGDTYKINFVNENKTIDEVEIWKEILKLIDKKGKVIDLMADHIYEHDISTTGLYEWRDNEQIKECFYKEVEEGR